MSPLPPHDFNAGPINSSLLERADCSSGFLRDFGPVRPNTGFRPSIECCCPPATPNSVSDDSDNRQLRVSTELAMTFLSIRGALLPPDFQYGSSRRGHEPPTDRVTVLGDTLCSCASIKPTHIRQSPVASIACLMVLTETHVLFTSALSCRCFRIGLGDCGLTYPWHSTNVTYSLLTVLQQCRVQGAWRLHRSSSLNVHTGSEP